MCWYHRTSTLGEVSVKVTGSSYTVQVIHVQLPALHTSSTRDCTDHLTAQSNCHHQYHMVWTLHSHLTACNNYNNNNNMVVNYYSTVRAFLRLLISFMLSCQFSRRCVPITSTTVVASVMSPATWQKRPQLVAAKFCQKRYISICLWYLWNVRIWFVGGYQSTEPQRWHRKMVF